MDALEHGQVGDTRIFGVFPSDAAKLVGRTTFDRSMLLACAAMGREDMREALSIIT